MNEQGHGATLLGVTAASFYRIIPLLLGPPMLLAGIVMTFGARGSRWAGVLYVFLGFGLAVMGLRSIGKRTVLFEVTERGIMIYAKAEGIDVSFSLLRDLFIPWERLEAMRFLTRKQISAEGLWAAVGHMQSAASGCIGLQLRTDPGWPPEGTLRRGTPVWQGRSNEIYLDLLSCSPTGMTLWKQMTEIVARRGGANVVVEAAPTGGRG